MSTETITKKIDTDVILNSITDGVITIGTDMRIEYLNKAAIELLGYSEEEVIGQNCSRLMRSDICTTSCILKRTMDTGEPISNFEAIIKDKSGRPISVSINTALLRDKDGRIIGGVEIFRDLSKIKELTEKLDGKYSFQNIIGKNHRMQEIYDLLHPVAQSKSTVLIEGESGTGKELIAMAIHQNSPRRLGPFIKVNCAALAEGILESELFGHVKGAFTGAISDKKGRFELAHKGTIFLDEIGEMSMHTQVKLLRVLQEEEFERVGGTESIKVDVRVIAATNKDLAKAMEKGEFRNDLYYRLRVVPIYLPPLRERKDDIPHLIKHFVGKLNNEMGKEINNVSPRVMDFLMDYDYKGNIRELENILEHAFVRCQGNTILAEHLPKDLFGAAEKLPENIIADSDNPLMAIERELVLKMLNQYKWKQGEVAKKLHISRATLWRKMKQHKIEAPRLYSPNQ